MFQLRGFAEWLIKAQDWAFFRRVTNHHPELASWTAKLGRPERLTAAINYYRANIGILLKPDRTKVAVPVMGIYSDGSYGIAKGLIYSFPVRCAGGAFEIVQGLDIDAFSRERMTATEAELIEERDAVAHLLPG